MNDTFVSSAALNQPVIVPVSQFNENGRVHEGFGEMIGQSRAWRQIIELQPGAVGMARLHPNRGVAEAI
jgi:hypothetical protein